MTAPDAFRLVGTTIGRYQLHAPLGKGGFAEVYRALDRLDDVEVAIKVLTIPAHLSEAARKEFIAGFEKEATLTRKVFRGRDDVRQVLDMGVFQGPDGQPHPWIAMELLDGETLKEWLDRRRGQPPLGEREAVDFLGPVLDAMAFAHGHGVAHRDLKPANVFLARDAAGKEKLKVLDFGIAKLLSPGELPSSGDTATSSAFLMFSHTYGAPEQFAGKRTGAYTDVFALGLILTELLSGKSPLADSGDRTDCMTASLDRRERPTPATRGRTVSSFLEAAISKAVACAETARHPDAGALAADLRRAVRDEAPAVAPPPRPAEATADVGTHFAERVPAFVPPAQTASKDPGTDGPVVRTSKAERPAPGAASRGVRIAAAGAGILAIAGGGIFLATRGTSLDGRAALQAPPPAAAPAPAEDASKGASSIADASRAATAPDAAAHREVDAGSDAGSEDGGLPGDELIGDYTCRTNYTAGFWCTCKVRRNKAGVLTVNKVTCSALSGTLIPNKDGSISFSGREFNSGDGDFTGASTPVSGRLVKIGKDHWKIPPKSADDIGGLEMQLRPPPKPKE